MKKKIKTCNDPRQLAFATWSLLSNNPINKMYYLLFCLMDFIIVFYYVLTLTQRLHFSNIKFNNEGSYDEKLNNTTAQTKFNLELVFLKEFNEHLANVVQNYTNSLVLISGIILGLCSFILITLLLMGVFINNHVGLEKQSIMKKCFCLILVLIQAFLHTPIFDVLVRTIISIISCEDLSLISLGYCITSFAMIIFIVLMFYLIRMFNICIPTKLIPWCAPSSNLGFLNLIIKGLLVISISFDIYGKYTLYEIIIIFFMQLFQAIYRLLFVPNYLKVVDIIIKTKDFGVCLLLFISLICKAVHDKEGYDLMYFLISFPFVTFGWIQLETFRKKVILYKIMKKSLKLEIDYEYALYVMMTLVNDTSEEKMQSQVNFGYLMDLVNAHIEECDDQQCICYQMENFNELMKLKKLHSQEVFPLLRHERKKFKKITDDQGLVGTISNFTDITLKLKTSQSTLGKINSDLDAFERIDEIDEQELQLNLKNLQDSHLQEIIKKKSEKKKIQTRQLYRININETKRKFLSTILSLFTQEYIMKFPYSFKIQLFYNYFILNFQKNEMMCIYQMRNFTINKLSKIDQTCHYINEQYLINEVQKVQKEKIFNQNSQEGSFNGEQFIKMNQLQQDFNISIESLASSVSNFWKIFEKDAIDVQQTLQVGSQIAKNVKSVYSIFSDLDSIKTSKDYQMYFQFALVQLLILNDPVVYDFYIGKMKSTLEINKIHQKNYSKIKNTDYSSFVIVDANKSKFGQILQINNSFKQLIGISEKAIKNARIESFMPTLIREKHPEFILRYQKTGQSYILNNKVTMFIKNANGYVVPIELYIKFHYSIDFKYTYVAILRPFTEMAPFQNQITYNINQLIFFIVDNVDGSISEFSESCKQLLNFGNYLKTDGITKNISDFIQDFNFKKFKMSRQKRYIINEIYEQEHKIDVLYFKDTQQEMYYQKIRKYNNTSVKQEHQENTHAKIRVFEERYSGGLLNMNIFCLLIKTDQDNSLNIQRSILYKSEQIIVQRQLNVKQPYEIKDIKEEEMIRGSEESVTGSSSNYTSSSSLSEFRNIHSYTKQDTPKSLKIIIQMIIALYLIMMIISSVNLGMILTRQVQSKNDIFTVRQAFDRMNWLSMNQLLLRVISNIANGYEPEVSPLVADGFKDYQSLLSERIEMLKSTQKLLQNSKFSLSQEFYEYQKSQNVALYYINEQNKFQTQYETLEIAINLYLSKVTEINSKSQREIIGNLQVQTLTPRLDSNYKPTVVEQTLFFVLENGNRGLRECVIDVATMYARESEQHAQLNIDETKIINIVSIIAIVIIGLIIAPLLTKTEIRKYKALLYFLKIPKEKIVEMLKNCEYCLNMNEKNRFQQIQKDYERILGVKIVNQQVEQQMRKSEEEPNLNDQESREITDEAISISNFYSQSNHNFPSGISKSLYKMSTRSLIKQEDIYKQKNSQQLNHGNYKKPNTVQSELQDNNEEDENYDNGSKDENTDLNTNKLNQSKHNLLLDSQKQKYLSNESEDDINDNDIQKIRKDKKQQLEKSEIQIKSKLITSRANKRRSTLIFYQFIVIISLCSYFLISYFMAMNTFQTASSVIGSLEIIFYKGSCFDSTFNFFRESLVRNESLYLEQGDTIGATERYIDSCLERESDYNKLRRNLPKYLNEASYFIKNLESHDFCEFIYQGEFQTLYEFCKIALNGIMSQGQSNAFYYMFTQIQKANMKYNSLGVTGERTAEQLIAILGDPIQIDMLDLKAKVLDPSLNELKQICMDSVIKYVQNLLRDFVIAFAVFAFLLTVGVILMVFFGFKILRKSMWDTNIVLKIIPFETLSKEDRSQIKDFFNA